MSALYLSAVDLQRISYAMLTTEVNAVASAAYFIVMVIHARSLGVQRREESVVAILAASADTADVCSPMAFAANALSYWNAIAAAG